MSVLLLTAFSVVAVGPQLPHDAGAVRRGLTLLAGGGDIHNIKHVVMVMQENRSFDSYFGTYPGVNGIPMVNGVPSACLPSSLSATCHRPYHELHEINVGGPHSSTAENADVNGGAMDGYLVQAENAFPGCWHPDDASCRTGPAGDVLGYHDATEIPNYWQYAQNFVLQDQMFESVTGWSLTAHESMVSGWAASCNGADPMTCTSAPTGGMLPPEFQRTPPIVDPVYPWTDITHLLSKNNVSWKYYVDQGTEPDCQNPDATICAPVIQNAKTPGHWNPLPWFTDVAADNQLGNITSTADYYSDAKGGTLPAVSWVVPSDAVSEHPPRRISDGQAYVTSVINAAMNGPDWSSTAIFLSWDDWGGNYDHVKPPTVDTLGYGLRVPGLVISPYAKAGFIDHQSLSFDAYLKFIEDDFLGGARLDPATDGRPDSRPDVREANPQLGDLTADFDFTQAPRPPLLLPTRPWPAPTLVSATSNTGLTAGGNQVRLQGTNLATPDTKIFVDATAAATTVVDDSTVDVTMPPHAAGTVALTISTRGGATPALPYTYTAPTPRLDSLTPMEGPLVGGNAVTITGFGFTAATAVTFGSLPATSFKVNSDTSITAVAPAQPAGPVAVTVSTAGGTTPANTASTYSYSARPWITALTPRTGPPSGGTTVTITGVGLSGATSVTFGAVPAAFTVLNDTTVTATAPAHLAGDAYVQVSTGKGTSIADFWRTRYTYVVPPSITAMTPARGSMAGGTTVTLTGTGFTATTKVWFGPTPAYTVTVLNSTTLTATAPARPKGGVYVKVTTAAGTSTPNSSTNWFIYGDPPNVTGRAPTHAPLAGGTTITLTGTGFAGATRVAFGPTPATSFTVIDDTTITATSPARPPGTVYLTVTTPAGTSTANFWTNQFVYGNPPTVTGRSPSRGTTAGGDTITLTGSGFTGTTRVTFGATPATSFTVVNDSTITATSPAHAAGGVYLQVTTAIGTSPPDFWTNWFAFG